MWGRNLKFEVLGHKMSRKDKCKVSLRTSWCGKSSTKAEIIVTTVLSPWDKSPWSSGKVSWTFGGLVRSKSQKGDMKHGKMPSMKNIKCWSENRVGEGRNLRECPSSRSGSPRGRSLAGRSKGPNGDTKNTSMILVKNIKGVSVNHNGKGKGFRKSPSSRNRWSRGRSFADRSVHCRNTIKNSERHSNLERNTTEEEIGGWKAPARLGTCR